MKEIPKIGLCLCIAATLLLSTAAATSSFPDIPDSASYAEAAEYLNEIGIMQGDTNGNFNPDKNVTRAQMAAIICRMYVETDVSAASNTSFSDVPKTYWASGYIAKASALGIINGRADGTFGPNDSVTYEQALAMVLRAMGLTNEAGSAGGYPDGYIKIADESGFSANLSASKGTALTRWQIAQLLYNISL